MHGMGSVNPPKLGNQLDSIKPPMLGHFTGLRWGFLNVGGVFGLLSKKKPSVVFRYTGQTIKTKINLKLDYSIDFSAFGNPCPCSVASRPRSSVTRDFFPALKANASIPETCGVAMLVPLKNE